MNKKYVKCKCKECNLSNSESKCPLLAKINFFIEENKRIKDTYQRLIDKVRQLNADIYN